MKNFSIKKRISLYYSIVLVTITVLIFIVFMMTVDLEMSNSSHSTISGVVQNGFDDIECNNNVIEIDNDFDAYSKGVTMLIYNENGSLILGSIPSGFPSHTPLVSGEYQEIAGDNETWLVYDLSNSYVNGENIWIRGIYAIDNATSTLGAILRVMAVVIPLILFFAIWVGRRITKKAFEPVSEITEAAESINSGSDLSKRLPLQASKDELYYLTETLNNMMDRLEEAFKSEKQFSSDVSHELKTPVSVILAECEYILSENRDANLYRESILSIQKQCERTMGLISQLLQLSRTMNKNLIITKELIDFSLLCTSLADSVDGIARKSNIRIIKDIDPDIMLYADETLMMRMLSNLVGNAIKYGKEGGYVKLSAEKDLSESDYTVKITVSDNGIGISPEDQGNVFNRFYKVDKSRNYNDNSFGLGLSMVKWIVDAHKGKLQLESQPGVGSRFIVYI